MIGVSKRREQPRRDHVDDTGLRKMETRPLTVRVKAALRQSILNDGFSDGRLPREETLASQLGVSRGTVREALRSLEEEGLITRQRGIGTHVNSHVARARISLNRVIGFYDLIAEGGYSPAIAATRIRLEPAPPEAIERLSLEAGAELLMIDRLFLADGVPAIHLIEMVSPASIGHKVFAEDVPESIFAFADQHCVAPIDHTTVEIIPIVATEAIAQILPVRRSSPLLELLETHYSSAGVPFIVSRIHVVDRFIRFTVVRRRF